MQKKAISRKARSAPRPAAVDAPVLLADHAHARHVLPCGLTVVLVEQPHLHRATLSAFVGAGSRYETAADNGLAHFLEHMLFRGTARFPTSHALNLAVERLGGTLEAATAPDSTELTVTLPAPSLDAGVEVLADVLSRPRLDDIEVERRVIAEEIREDLGEDGRPIDIDLLTRRRVWPDHALGQSVTGPLENVLRFGVADLRRLLEARYVGPNAVFCAAGRFEPARLLDAIERAFAQLPAGPLPAPSPAPRPGAGPTAYHRHKPGSQTQLRLAFAAPGEDDADAPALAMLDRLIDDGMAAPLHRRVFEELGLAYSVGAGLEWYPDAGAYQVDASCAHENVPELVGEILATLADVRDRAVAGELATGELARARERAVWDLESWQDRPQAMAVWYGEQELFRRPRSLAAEAAAIRAVSPADVGRVAARVLAPENLHATTVGALGARERARVERAVTRWGRAPGAAR